MKLFVISDIHGSLTWTQKAIDKFNEEKAEQIVICGDLLYHGPRNALPEGYDPKGTAKLLNKYKDKIICVRGNCDGEVDQMVLEFPMLSEYSLLFLEGKKIFLTHGHHWNKDIMPPLAKDDILLHGHTHILKTEKIEGKFIINPGSITNPKNNLPNTYGILENNMFKIKTFDGKEVSSIFF